MAKDRFLFWRSYYDALELLDDADAGRLVKAMCAFAFDERETDLSDSPALRLAWTMISGEIRESVENGRNSSENGKRGGRPRKTKTPPLREPKRVPESVSKYVSTSSDYAPSLDAQALVADSEPPASVDATADQRWAGVVPMSYEEAGQAVTAILASLEEQECGDG